jgi:hypothetical protein
MEHLGQPEKYQFKPHITVDKEHYDKAKSLENPTAHDMGIQFGEPKLAQGKNTLRTYKTIMKAGALRGMKAALLGGLAFAGQGMVNPTPVSPDSVPHARVEPAQMKNTGLKAIAQVESGGGKYTHHKTVNHGLNAGSSAYGSYGLEPITMKEYLTKNPRFKAHRAAASLPDDQLKHYVAGHKGLEDQIASAHYDRLSNIFGGDIDKIGHAWFNGVAGTQKALASGKDLKNHWHVKKIHHAFTDLLNQKAAPNPLKPQNNRKLP